ncbi:hypothetical protein DTO207G8_834 [Paecilomyces variotii]|nr:hypothetical protein DTO169C6_9196 [Paecilomyces variotii]KAJ9260137.1 hypothetical protein DTO207G8_834 [Paecilomyces variotii]KAJ9262225.1 hypothetical protein DTO195F2_3612 [Paecilomyces variotii]KAJ9286521.1 hypothetical protein DTO021C3_5869 [Paecilomyces variotii]KAJ9368111.1 hypothetical protein DTO282E5_7227 [Paecilomyces variotii]
MRKLLVPFYPACYDLVDSDRSTVEWVVLVRSEQLKQRGLSKIIRPLGAQVSTPLRNKLRRFLAITERLNCFAQ